MAHRPVTRAIVMLAARPHIEPRRVASADSVMIKEIYLSLQGESSHQGLLCAFVRLTGCHLRCTYCDSEFAFDGGNASRTARSSSRRSSEDPARRGDRRRAPAPARRGDVALVHQQRHLVVPVEGHHVQSATTAARRGEQDQPAARAVIGWYREAVRDGFRHVLSPRKYDDIAVETLLVWGMKDPALGYEELVPGTEEFVPKLKIEQIPDCGHFVHAERPEWVNPALIAFMGVTVQGWG